MAVVVGLMLSGCADPGITVLAASSVAPVVQSLSDTLSVSEAGSQVLVAQLRAGAQAEVIVLADPELAADLAHEGLAGPPSIIATTELALLVRRGSGIARLSDLTDGDLDVVIADDVVPLGRYTRDGLQRAEDLGVLRPGGAQAVLAMADSLESSARAVRAKLTAGEADVAIVYRADAVTSAAADEELEVLPWPGAAQVRATYTAQVVTGSRAGEAVVAMLTSREAAAVWRARGFEPATG